MFRGGVAVIDIQNAQGEEFVRQEHTLHCDNPCRLYVRFLLPVVRRQGFCDLPIHIEHLDGRSRSRSYLKIPTTTTTLMRRKNQEIKDKAVLHDIIDKAEVMRLGMCRDNKPYVVPLSFGYDGEFIYFHGAKAGMKTDYLKDNPNVCFEMESKSEVIRHETDACKFSFSYRSVIGFGEASEVKGNDEKRKALSILMNHYSKKDWKFPLAMLLAVGVWQIKVTSLFGKQSKDHL